MTQFNSKPTMRKKILEEATLLFYENGYSNTTIKQIACNCNISKGLVNYHYPSKEEIAFEIYDNVTNEHKYAVQSKMFIKYHDVNPIISQAIIDRLSLQHMKNDHHFYRFFKEVSPLRLGKRSEGIYHYKQLIQDSRLSINYKSSELQLIAATSLGAVTSLIIAYFDGNINCSYDEFENYRVEFRFNLLNLDKKKIKQIVEESKEMYTELDFKFSSNFHVE